MLDFSKLRRLLRSLNYFIYSFTDLYRLKSDANLNSLRPVNFLSWHHGFMYFSAKNSNAEKVFLKVDSEVMCVINETKICNFINHSQSGLKTPKVRFSKQYRKISVVIFDYISGTPLTMECIVNSPEILFNMYEIICSFSDLGLCHRDVKLDNFILSDELIFIDFTYTEILDSCQSKIIPQLAKAPIGIENDLGIKNSTSENTWNDYYSFLIIINRYLSNINTDVINNEYLVLKEECLLKSQNNKFTYSPK